MQAATAGPVARLALDDPVGVGPGQHHDGPRPPLQQGLRGEDRQGRAWREGAACAGCRHQEVEQVVQAEVVEQGGHGGRGAEAGQPVPFGPEPLQRPPEGLTGGLERGRQGLIGRQPIQPGVPLQRHLGRHRGLDGSVAAGQLGDAPERAALGRNSQEVHQLQAVQAEEALEGADGMVAEVLVVDGVEEAPFQDVGQVGDLEGEEAPGRQQVPDAVGHVREGV
jgi:hypothetical protein